jgi:hypothetical protein
MNKLIPVLVISAFLLSGCGGTSESSNISDSGKNTIDSTTTSATSTSPWECKSGTDGLGQDLICSTNSKDMYGTSWFLMLYCSSEKITRQTITGIDGDGSYIYWVESDRDQSRNTAKIRIDSQPVQNLRFTSAAQGEGFRFWDVTEKKFDENTEAWKVIEKLKEAKSFGFKAFDNDGYEQSVLFNVENSEQVATKFTDMGCRR